MKKLLILLSLGVTFISGNVIADEERYQAVILQQGGTGSEKQQGKVFILDSELGYMWTWEDKSKYTTAEGKMAFGTKLTYQGKLKPGKEIGEIVGHGMVR